MSSAIHCKVCGKPVDPAVDILFGALGNPLFAAHAVGCAPFVRETTQGVGALGWSLLRVRKPELASSLLGGVNMAKRVLAAIREPETKS